jgi:hypothetical protein
MWEIEGPGNGAMPTWENARLACHIVAELPDDLDEAEEVLKEALALLRQYKPQPWIEPGLAADTAKPRRPVKRGTTGL